MLTSLAWFSIAPLLAGASPSPINHHVVQPQTIAHFTISDTGVSTNETALTQEILIHCIAVKKEIALYWKSHPDLHSSAEATVHKTNIDVGGQQVEIRVLNYPALVIKDTVLAGIFKRNKFTPQQVQPTIIATLQAVGVLLAGSTPPDPSTVAGKNLALVKEHRQELHDIGIDLQKQQSGGSDDDLNP